MTRSNTSQNQQSAQQKELDYFDSIMFINQARINSVRPVKSNGKTYTALSISLAHVDDQGKKTYTKLEVNARGDKVNAILDEFREEWPTRNDNNHWIADIAVGSLKDSLYFSKKYNCNKPQLRGRLIGLSGLVIGGKTVIAAKNPDNQQRPPVLVAQAYINEIDMANKKAKAAILDGLVTEPTYRTILLDFADIAEFNKLHQQGLCPRGYDFRHEDAKLYGILEIENALPFLYQYEGEDKSCLKGTLTKLRYLKVNDTVMTKKSTVKKAVEGFKQGYAAA